MYTRKITFSDVMVVPKKLSINSRKYVNLNTQYSFKHSGAKWEGIPLICSNMDPISNDRMYNELSTHGIMSCLSKNITSFDTFFLEKDTYMLSTGITDKDIKRIDSLIDSINPKFVCIDLADGHFENLLYAIEHFHAKHHSRKITLCVGNVVIPELVSGLITNYGVDIVKIGICSGHNIKSGIGYPQISAIIECKEAAKSAGGFIMSDGGIKVPGDIAKAFVAGADFVMLDSILAGHYECDGEIIQKDGRLFMKHIETGQEKPVMVPFKGHLNDTVKDILRSLMSTCTYINAESIYELYDNGGFILTQ